MLFTESDCTVTPRSAAVAMRAVVVAGPLPEAMRKTSPSPVTSSTPGRVRRWPSQSGGASAKLTSRVFSPGMAALRRRGESSAMSLPWSTMATRSHSLSASSM